MGRRMNDISGQRFGMLKIGTYTAERSRDGHVMWEAECDCGNACLVSSGDLVASQVRSCGCQSKGHPNWKQKREKS